MPMNIRTSIAVALVSALPAVAQIEITCAPIHTHFLIGEESTVRLEVRNHTGVPLVLTGTNRNAKLTFELTTESGAAVPSKGELPFAPSDAIKPNQEWIRAVDLQPFFDLRNTGRLKLRAALEWDGNAYISAKCFFNIERGVEVFKHTVSSGTGKEKVTVKYSLRTLARDDGEILFLCLENPDTQMRFAAANLGTMVRLYAPQLLRDSAGRIHVLHQSAPNRFTHSEISATGRLREQEHFSNDYQMPEMKETDGTVLVRGRPYIPGDERRMPLGPDVR
jgi:hypothetical protein